MPGLLWHEPLQQGQLVNGAELYGQYYLPCHQHGSCIAQTGMYVMTCTPVTAKAHAWCLGGHPNHAEQLRNGVIKRALCTMNPSSMCDLNSSVDATVTGQV